MRIVICTAVGFGVGMLFLVNVLGWVSWCPSNVFMVLHYPSILIAGVFFPGEAGFWGSLPFLPIQWPVLGALFGLAVQFRHKSANPGLQRTPGSGSVASSGWSGPAPLS